MNNMGVQILQKVIPCQDRLGQKYIFEILEIWLTESEKSMFREW